MSLKWISILIFIPILYGTQVLHLYTSIVFENQRYNGIIVAFSPDISEDYGKQLVPPIKMLFTRASKLLKQSTHNMASFGQISIVVPNWWRNDSGIIEHEEIQKDYHKASFRIDEPHPVHGDNPYTLQSQGCGQGANFIHLTPSFLFSLLTNGRPIAEAARILVHNWVQFRYGVFPETGSNHQLQFPSHYTTQDGEKPTGCTNVELRGTWKRGDCTPGSRDCDFLPSDRQDTTLMTSLMSWPQLPQVDSFCDKTNHNPIAPTMHNALCHSRSVWEVMQDHPDFANNKPSVTQFPPPLFQVVKRQIPNRYVIIIDPPSQSNEKFKLSIMRATLSRLIMLYLPNNAQVAIIQDTDKLNIVPMMIRLDSVSTRNKIRRALPMFSAPGDKSMLTKAIHVAFESLFTDIGGTCIVVSLGRTDIEMANDQTIADFYSAIRHQPVTIMAVVIGEAVAEDTQPQQLASIQALTSLASASGGNSVVIQEQSVQHPVLAVAQIDALLVEAAKIMTPGLIQIDRHLSTADLRSGEFFVDEDGRNDLVFAVTFEDQFWPILLRSPSGRIIHSQHDSYNDHKDLQLVTISVESAEVGKWNYNILTGDFPTKNNLTTAITVTSISRKTKPIELDGWISVKKSNISTWPIIIYGQLLRGSNPVIDAYVQATVMGPNSQEILLYDIGNGDPDISKDDGVYSRYVPGHLKMGFYTVWLRANDNGTAKFLERREHEDSIIQRPAPQFQRVASLGSFYVGHSGDVCPPSRVADLRFLSSSRNRVNLGWTEPGDDFDSGKVIAFHFWWSEEVECLIHLERACGHEVLAESQIFPKGAGTFQTAIILLPPLHTRIIYMALTAEDSAHNLSPTSNVIAIFWNQVQPSLDAEQSYLIQRKFPGVFPFGRGHCTTGCLPSATLAVIIVCAVVISLMVIGIVIAFCFVEQRRRLRMQTPILRPRLDIIPESESERVLPEQTEQQFNNSSSTDESNNHQSMMLDHEPTDIVNVDDEENDTKEAEHIIAKIPSDDIMVYKALAGGKKGNFRFLRNNNNCSLSHSNITKCACNCHVTVNNPYSDLYV